MKRFASDSDDLEVSRAKLGAENKIEIFVMRLKANESITMTSYSKCEWGINVHWSKATRRSSPHFTDSERCPGCLDQLPRKELYYLHGFHIEKSRLIFLELTEGATKALRAQLGSGETMRGIGLFVKRTAADNGRLQVRVLNSHPHPESLPPDRDPLETLLRLWGIRTGDPRGGKEFPTSRNGFLSHAKPE